MGYTGFHTIYYHGFLKAQLAGIGERLAAMEQKYLYSITYETCKDHTPICFAERVRRLMVYYQSVGAVEGFAFGLDYNGCIIVVFDAKLDEKNPDRVFDGLQFEGLKDAPRIDKFMFGVYEEVLLDFAYNVRIIKCYGTLAHAVSEVAFMNFLSDEVTENA